MVIYANKSCSRSVMSVMGPTGILTGWFSGAIKCIKEQLVNAVIILKA